jgi:hypothetical protein
VPWGTGDDAAAVTDDAIHAAELDAILAELEGANLVEQYVNANGEAAMRLTARGQQVANQAAMGSEDDAVALLDGLLEAQG